MSPLIRVLVIDDSAYNRRTIIKILNAIKGVEVLDYACDGEEGLRKVFDLKPDLITLDLEMPKIDGFEVLRQVKGAPYLMRIPIIVLTSSTEEGDRALGYDCGANSYLVKPISFAGFLAVVRNIGDYWLTLNVKPPLHDISPE